MGASKDRSSRHPELVSGSTKQSLIVIEMLNQVQHDARSAKAFEYSKI